MATKLEVINNIMRRLRGPTVTSSTSTAYSRLISSIVAEAYEEVLDEWNWRPVTHNYWMDVLEGQEVMGPFFTLRDFGPKPDGRLVALRESGKTFAHSFRTLIGPPTPGLFSEPENYDEMLAEQGVPLTELTLHDFVNLGMETDIGGGVEGSVPTHFAIRPQSDEEVVFLFWPAPKVQFTFQIVFYSRPPRLQVSDVVTDDSTTFQIPFRPVQELAMMYALNERGEEMGESGNLAQGRYIQALSTAKEIDLKAGEHANNYDWGRD